MRSIVILTSAIGAFWGLVAVAGAPIDGTPVDPGTWSQKPMFPSDRHKIHEPAWDRIERWNSFLPPEEKLVKYCAMSTDSFRFYRGTNHLFFEEHTGGATRDPRFQKYGGTDKELAWTMGDLHPENFGT